MTPHSADTPLIRFSLSQRLEHLFLLVSFTMLVVTGLPQRYSTNAWAAWSIALFGGIDTIRHIHRIFAAIFMVESVYHIGYVAWSFFFRKVPLSMLPTWKDARDIWHRVLFFVGFRKEDARCDRFDYQQKLEYFGVVWGGAVMILTGLVMIFPTEAARFLPGELIPAAKEAHGGEAMLAFAVIITWHLYGAHLNPHRFPADLTIFTGRISRERMKHEHPVELERMERLESERTDENQPSS